MAILASAALSVSLLSNSPVSAASPTTPIDVSVSLTVPEPAQPQTVSPIAAATSFMRKYRLDWGLGSVTFGNARVMPTIDGTSVVRFTQTVSGHEVLGSLAAISLDENQALLGYTIKTGSIPANTKFLGTPAIAVRSATMHYAQMHKVLGSQVRSHILSSAIASPELTSFGQSEPKNVWIVRSSMDNAPASVDTIYVDDATNKVIYSASSVRDVTSAPLVCNMQLTDGSYAAAGNKGAISRMTASVKLSTRQHRSGEAPISGLKSRRLWVSVATTYGGGVSSKITAIRVPRGHVVTFSPKFSNLDGQAVYGVFVGTGKKKPTQSKMRLWTLGYVVDSATETIDGKLPKSGTTMRSVGVSSGHTSSFINLNGATLPLCNSKNAGTRAKTKNKLDAKEKTQASKFIKRTRTYFKTYIGIDINNEQYLGNISPKLNFNKSANCGPASDNTPITSGYCTPRISAFTNVCASMNGSISCPNFANAFWTPWMSHDCRSDYCSGIFMGRGFVADDVVSHELAHGVTSATSFALGYLTNDANSLSEAYSDFFGEALDQLYVAKGEKADRRWAMGEDVKGPVSGPFRYMNGAAGISAIGLRWNSQGDEHYNNGPANRFAWLLANGGVQNTIAPTAKAKITIRAIGSTPADGLCHKPTQCTAIINMNKLVFQALPNLTSSSTYFDFSRAMRMACQTLTRKDSRAFPASYCEQVRLALIATGISTLTIEPLTISYGDTAAENKIVTSIATSSKISVRPALNSAAAGIHVKLQTRINAADAWHNSPVVPTFGSDNELTFTGVNLVAGSQYRVITVKDTSTDQFSSPIATAPAGPSPPP